MSWSEFISRLGSLDLPSTPPIWRTSDGQMIRHALPIVRGENDDQIIRLGNSMSPYKLYEVVEMEFAAGPTSEREAQLDILEQAARISGLIYRRKPDRIIIRSPYTC